MTKNGSRLNLTITNPKITKQKTKPNWHKSNKSKLFSPKTMPTSLSKFPTDSSVRFIQKPIKPKIKSLRP